MWVIGGRSMGIHYRHIATVVQPSDETSLKMQSLHQYRKLDNKSEETPALANDLQMVNIEASLFRTSGGFGNC